MENKFVYVISVYREYSHTIGASKILVVASWDRVVQEWPEFADNPQPSGSTKISTSWPVNDGSGDHMYASCWETGDVVSKYGAQESNPLPAKYHEEVTDKISMTVDWNDPRLKRVIRLRLLSDPGYPSWDVSYCHGELRDGTIVRVSLPFDQLPCVVQSWSTRGATASTHTGSASSAPSPRSSEVNQ